MRLYEHLGPATSFDDEREVNDTLGQLLMVMNILDEEIGGWRCPGKGLFWVPRLVWVLPL